MAEAVKNGDTIPAVARRFMVTIRTVQNACHEFDVPLPAATSAA